MTRSSWSALFAAAVFVGGTSLQGQIRVLPLVDEGDPIVLSDAAFDATDPERPAITVRLENTAKQPFSTDRIWISFLRFYTPDETLRNGDRKIWDCGLDARANHSQPTQIIQPGTIVEIRMLLGNACTLNPEHEHFSAGVSHISAGPRYRDFIWQRAASDHSRLLQAAMLKVH